MFVYLCFPPPLPLKLCLFFATVCSLGPTTVSFGAEDFFRWPRWERRRGSSTRCLFFSLFATFMFSHLGTTPVSYDYDYNFFSCSTLSLLHHLNAGMANGDELLVHVLFFCKTLFCAIFISFTLHPASASVTFSKPP